MRPHLIAVAGLLSVACTRPAAHFTAGGCPPSGEIAPPSSSVGPNDWIELSRTGCLGSCPSYVVRVYGDGNVVWKGRDYVAVVGEAKTEVKAGEVAALFEEARAKKFWGLCAEYPPLGTDLPSEDISITVAGHTKKVMGNFGTEPEWLSEFALAIDNTADTHRWRHGDPQKEQFLGCLGGDMGPCDQLGYDGEHPKPGVTPLMRAAAKSDLRQVTTLLKQGANPNGRDSSGWTALMYAARSASPDVLKALLDAGADAKVRSIAGQVALAACTGPQRLEQASLLIAAGGDVRN
jgi:Domain of unknown function (DUF6438)/Ankyrin repeats (3 copies)